MERRFLLSPNLLHREDALPEQSPSGLEVGAVILHLLGVPATTDAEEEPPAGEAVERGHFFRRDDGIALDDEADSGTEAQAGCRHGGRSERAERVASRPRLFRHAGTS